MTDGAALIAAERARQIGQEDWTPEHDAEHTANELPRAAMAYVEAVVFPGWVSAAWPWSLSFWKPSTPIRMLVKAGALIAAEIDRRIAAGEKA